MNKEIEEILNELKNQISYVENTDENVDFDIYICKNNVIKLLDYITKLQEDNEYLNKCNIELARRNTKAMEYIENDLKKKNYFEFDENGAKYLLNILKGSDKEC